MKSLALIGLFTLFFASVGSAQNDSLIKIDAVENVTIDLTNPHDSFFSRAWLPVGLSIISVDLMRDSTKYGLQRLARSFVADTFRTHVDDYIHYVPILMMYTADLCGVPAKNNMWNQTKYLIISEAITSGIVWSLKIGLGIQRPNNGTYNAYPSGHTSQAFVQSQVLYNEFRETAPLLAASGHLFSVATGALRVLNNRHWVPDVLLGAGIGILVTNVIYYFEPLKNWNPFQKKRTNLNRLDVSFTPSFNGNYVGGQFRIRL